MEVPCGGARGQVVARCLGEDGCDADATSREVHLELSRQSPLPELLLAQSCLQSLGDDAVARLAASWDGQLPLPCLAEVRRGALLQLLGVAHAMLGRFETSLQSDLHERAQPRDAAAVDARLAMAVCARLGEKEVLAATAREVVGRLLALLEELEGRDEARTGGSAWWRLLNDSAGAVAAAQQRTVAHFQLLQATPLGDSATTASTLVQAGSLIFMWLHDLLRHPCRQAVDGPAAAARWLAWAEEAAEKQNPQLSLLFEKVAFWGAYLLAQFAVCGAFDLSALNTMQQESLDVRQRQCCCVPSRAALRLLGRFAPLLLVGDDRAGGDGPGPWAQLLQAQGVDVEEAAPPSADLGAGALAAARARGAGRTLVLLAVDRARGGGGPCAESAAAACLRAYSGETLLLVGEWRGHTFGLHGAAGGSFAAAFQEGVAAAFWEEASEPLPCWPLALDRVSVWRRRGAA
ncbi:unnamed protein product [Prorocentrum cordatum]|uniref:Separase n=1 Tax=Prorocentrum cordatum TaxID=2364126 RepID=A0ABN9RXT6_9DINO|nr:unnamed protein product [Polarella glacialis]